MREIVPNINDISVVGKGGAEKRKRTTGRRCIPLALGRTFARIVGSRCENRWIKKKYCEPGAERAGDEKRRNIDEESLG